MTTPKDILDFIKKNDIEFVDFKFIDLLGTWQHLQVPIGWSTKILWKKE